MNTDPNPADTPDPFEAISRMADEAAAKLAEHCDSVVIVCTFPRPAEDRLGPRTGLVAGVAGNYYAQQGSVAAWLDGNPEFDAPPTPPKPRADDDGEAWKGGEA